MKQEIIRLSSLSKELDAHGMHEHSAEVVKIMKKLAGMHDKPRFQPGQSIPDHLEAVDKWAEQGDWQPLPNEVESPCPDGEHKLLRVWQPRSKMHGYYITPGDIVVTDKDIRDKNEMYKMYAPILKAVVPF